MILNKKKVKRVTKLLFETALLIGKSNLTPEQKAAIEVLETVLENIHEELNKGENNEN